MDMPDLQFQLENAIPARGHTEASSLQVSCRPNDKPEKRLTRSTVRHTEKRLSDSHPVCGHVAWNPGRGHVSEQQFPGYCPLSEMSSVRWSHGSLYWQDPGMSLKAGLLRDPQGTDFNTVSGASLPTVLSRSGTSLGRDKKGSLLVLPSCSAVHALAAVIGKLTAGALSVGLPRRALWHVHSALWRHVRTTVQKTVGRAGTVASEPRRLRFSLLSAVLSASHWGQCCKRNLHDEKSASFSRLGGMSRNSTMLMSEGSLGKTIIRHGSSCPYTVAASAGTRPPKTSTAWVGWQPAWGTVRVQMMMLVPANDQGLLSVKPSSARTTVEAVQQQLLQIHFQGKQRQSQEKWLQAYYKFHRLS
ncbi:hypothetical protein ACRRTK_003978 [Alexandromys fortis]